MLKAQLYNDLHPDKSLKNTGFKDREKAINTINLITKRSLRYQFDVINTMYNRAKFHPHKTAQMEEAMVIFKKWLSSYPKLKKYENKMFGMDKFLTLEQIEKYEKLAKIYKISGIVKGINFLEMYKDVNGKANKLQYIPINLDKPDGLDYWSYRIQFIKYKLSKIEQQNTPLYYVSGKYKNLPTKQHIILILHGYSPDKKI